VWGDPYVNEQTSNTRNLTASSSLGASTLVSSTSRTAQESSRLSATATQQLLTGANSVSVTSQRQNTGHTGTRNITSGSTVSGYLGGASSASSSSPARPGRNATAAIPQTLDYVGTIVEFIQYSSSVDYTYQIDSYDARGDLYDTFTYIVIADSNAEIAQQIQDCQQLGNNVQNALGYWSVMSAVGVEMIGGLLGIAADVASAGTATVGIEVAGVGFTGAVASLEAFHQYVTIPLISGMVVSHCMGNIVDNISLADYLITPEPISINTEFVLVCDEYSMETEDTSRAENVDPQDDAAYEIVVTGSSTGTLVCTQWHWEAVVTE